MYTVLISRRRASPSSSQIKKQCAIYKKRGNEKATRILRRRRAKPEGAGLPRTSPRNLRGFTIQNIQALGRRQWTKLRCGRVMEDTFPGPTSRDITIHTSQCKRIRVTSLYH
ncbi:unnamed protein product [Colias eurytheme]|nr:unnamed protein product [Colias eurytheme]